MVYFAVEDADAATEAAKEAGAHVRVEPFNVEACGLAALTDPHGTAFAVIHQGGDGSLARRRRRSERFDSGSQDEEVGAVESEQAQEGAIAPELLAEHAEAYRADVVERQSRTASKLDAELRELEKVEKQYRRPLERALEREGGAEAAAMKHELTELVKEPDPEAAGQKANELERRHGELMKRAMATSGIDLGAARRKLLSAIGHPELASKDAPAVEADAVAVAGDVELIETDSLGFSLITTPPKPPPPPPAPTTVDFAPPYPHRHVSTPDQQWARADAATGRLYARSHSAYVGSFQTLASVGATLSVGPRVRRVRVEATVGHDWSTIVGAALGYASAEAKLNLIVRDGPREIASHRLSLGRSIAIVLFASQAWGSGPVPLLCEFDRTPDSPSAYSVIVEAETWAGGAGLPVSAANAQMWVNTIGSFRSQLYT